MENGLKLLKRAQPLRAKQNNKFNSLYYLLTTSYTLKIISIEIRHDIAFNSLTSTITQDKELTECNIFVIFTTLAAFLFTSMSNTFALFRWFLSIH
jgi:hypothetical protein